ncbi:MAG: hypothetical protein LBB38_01945 [Puniceicoccales bacterium]|jgi:hypothetical protein|nr:hypothetical protein [Puniceicoccales bacterium]
MVSQLPPSGYRDTGRPAVQPPSGQNPQQQGAELTEGQLQEYIRAASAGDRDARNFLRRLITPLNIFGNSKFTVADFGQLIQHISGTMGTAISLGTNALKVVNSLTEIAKYAEIMKVAGPAGTAISITNTALRTLRLLYALANKDILWEANGFQLEATPLEEASSHVGGTLTDGDLALASSAALLCDAIYDKATQVTGEQTFAAVSQFFSPTDLAMLRSNGYIDSCMLRDGSFVIKNPSNGFYIAIKHDQETGKLICAPGIGHGTGKKIPKALLKPFGSPDEELSFLRAVDALRSGTAIDPATSEIVVERAVSYVEYDAKPKKINFGAIARAANMSGIADPSWTRELATPIKYVMSACLQKDIPTDDIVLTGYGSNGAVAQYAAVKNRLQCVTFDSDGFGPAVQGKLGSNSVAENAGRMINFETRNKIGDTIASAVGAAAFIVVDLNTPACFGGRIDVPIHLVRGRIHETLTQNFELHAATGTHVPTLHGQMETLAATYGDLFEQQPQENSFWQ